MRIWILILGALILVVLLIALGVLITGAGIKIIEEVEENDEN